MIAYNCALSALTDFYAVIKYVDVCSSFFAFSILFLFIAQMSELFNQLECALGAIVHKVIRCHLMCVLSCHTFRVIDM